MNVLIVNTMYHPNNFGGAEISVQALAEKLASLGNNITVVCTHKESFDEESYINGVRVIYLSLLNVYWPFRDKRNPIVLKPIWHAIDSCNVLMGMKVAKIISLVKPDIVHTNNLLCFSPIIWKCAKVKNIPVIHTLRDHYLVCPRCTMFKYGHVCKNQCFICRILSAPKKRLSYLVDGLVGISDYILRRHTNHSFFLATDVRKVIGNPIDAIRRNFKEENKLSVPLNFGYLGLISPEKGVETLLEVFKELPPDRFCLKVAGRIDKRHGQSVGKIERAPNIIYLGYVKPCEFFEEIDVLVVPSKLNEPFGRVIVEAYSYGIPVIGTKVGGIPELIDEDKTGWLVHPGEIQSLYKLIKMLPSKLEGFNNIKSYCLTRARMFEVDKITSDYISIYKEVLRMAG